LPPAAGRTTGRLTVQCSARSIRRVGSAEITLITSVNNRTGSGDHSALFISAGHRVLYDPAGSWHSGQAPRRNDVVYGLSPQIEQ